MRNSRAFTISVYGKPNFKIELTESPKTYFEWSDRQREAMSQILTVIFSDLWKIVSKSISIKINQDTFPKN